MNNPNEKPTPTAPQENGEQQRPEKGLKPKEIERKFLISSLPENLDSFPHKEIAQGYIVVTPDGTEVRLRRKGDKYYQTVKSGSGMVRDENEVELTEEQYSSLWGTTEGKRLEKTRYEIPYNDCVIELDIYHGDLNGLVTAEVEFVSEEAGKEFIPPSWFGEEVTEDKSFKNQRLALNGMPEALKETAPEYELQEGVSALVDLTKEKMTVNENGTTIVEIAGGSASGKTSAVANKLMEALGEGAVLISMDDYYRGGKFMKNEAEQGRVLNWDQPEALNIELLKQQLEDLKQGKPIQKPKYDFKTGEPIGFEEISPAKVVVIEGLFALNDLLKAEGDVKAFIDIGTHGRILRRLLRDIERTGQRPEDIIRYFSEVVEPMHDKYIQSTKKNADIVIRNEYKPKEEAERSGLHEVQLKFKGGVDNETLRKLGAEKLSETVQVDHYYNPKDRDLTETDELLRIREEGSHTILTYKGPRVESEYRDRPKFEFDIDEDSKTKFLSIYGDMSKSIKKIRTLYQLDGMVFSVDQVIKMEGSEERPVGTFVEIRSTSKTFDEKKMRATLSKLGLQMEDAIKESYFELVDKE